MDSVDSGLPGGHAPAHWYDTWDRQASQNFSMTTKGLRNAPGENNCFLNSAVQVFWHIDVFRRSYRRLSGHLCMGHSCIFCALKVIFTQFQYSDQSSLQPSALRKALANTFEKQERFQLGHMDDAAECFENILLRIHYHIANTHNEDTCNAAHCIPHQKFAMTVCDQLVCPCGATSEPLKFHEMVHYISANALVSQARMMQETGDILHPSRFGLLLRNAGAIGNIRDCPGNCGKRVQIRRTLTNVPDVVSIGLVWGSDKPDPELTTEVARNIGTTLLLPDIFHSVMCNDVSKLPRLHLTSVVCYYGKHYSTFVWHTKLQEWIYFDDATVKQVGTEWEHVVEKIVRSRYQPLLLIFTNLNANPVSTETAPSTRVMATGYSMNPEKNLQASQDKLNSKRSQKSEKTDILSEQEVAHGDLQRKSSFEHRRQSSFLLAVTKQKHKEEAIYAVPHNNSKVMNLQKDTSVRGFVPGQGSGFSDIPEGQDVPDGYNYTLSNNDQYRRPGLNNLDPNKLPLTQNFSRVSESQRKDSFKKGKGNIPADIIRYQADPTRRSSVSSESDHGSPVHNSGQLVSNKKPALPAKPQHFRTRSQSLEDNLAESANSSQHTVIKPAVSGSGPNRYENIDSITRAHTPVQSGLATLPRKKNSNMSSNKLSSATLSHSDNQTGSQHFMAANYQYDAPPPPYSYHNSANQTQPSHITDTDIHSRQSSSSSILSQGTVIECSQGNGDGSHYRQSSSASQDTLTDKPKEKSKSKKDKDEKKKEERKQRKEEKKQKVKKDKISQKPPPLPVKQSSISRDEGFSEDQSYIDRKMVESVLSFQKLQRSGSCLSHTSTSSLESETHNRMMTTTGEIPFDAASLDSHKDSGYGSSDRNSSSSTGSITMNPYEQYFLSRSMIPPKTFNHQVMVENMRKLMDQGCGMNGLEYTQESDLMSLVPNPHDQHFSNNPTVGHCQAPPIYPQSSGRPMDDGISGLSHEVKDKYLYDAVSGRNKASPPPLQTHTITAGQTAHHGQGHTKDGHFQGHSSQDQIVKEESSQFLGLCQKAEDLMDSCVLSETSEQYGDALTYCQQAIGNLKIAMRLQNISQSSYTFVQKKSNSCLLKSRSLQKRLMYTRQESNGSTNSSDSAITDTRTQRNHPPPPRSQHQFAQSPGIARPPSRSSSQNSVDSMKDGSITSNNSGRSLTPVLDKEVRPPIEERVPPLHGHNSYGDRSFELNCPPPPGNMDVFGTMPRWKTQKSQDHVRMCNNQKHEDEVYQDFIENQRRQNGVHSRSNSGAQTPVNEPVLSGSNLQQGNQQGAHRNLHSGGDRPVLEQTFPNHSKVGPPGAPFSPQKHFVQSQHTEVGTPPHKVTNQHRDQCMHRNNTIFLHKIIDKDNLNEFEIHNDILNRNKRSNIVNTLPESITIHTAYSYPVHSITTVGQCLGVPQEHKKQEYLHDNQSLSWIQKCNRHSRRPLSRSLSLTNQIRPLLNNQDKRPQTGLTYKSWYGSQPDLSSLKDDSTSSLLIHDHHLLEQTESSDSAQVSVKDLKSRFEQQGIIPDSCNKNVSNNVPNKGHSVNSHQHLGRVNSDQIHPANQISNPPKVQRQRSKSESESQPEQKPKSVLSKRGKHGEKTSKPRKSVTFSADICNLAGSNSNDSMNGSSKVQTGYQSEGDIRSRKDDEDSTSSGSPVEIVGDRACMLCHKLGVEIGQSYCEKCTYYMSRFAPS